MSATRGKHQTLYGNTDSFQEDEEVISSGQVNADCDVNLQTSASRSTACCECDIWLDRITTAIFLAYSIFLVWLLAHLKGNWYYFLNLIPFFFIVVPTLIICMHNVRKSWLLLALRHFQLAGVVAILISTFTMLSREAYFHLSHNQTIGTNFVVVSLKASILVFLWQIFARKRFSVTKIKAGKDIITRLVLDGVDIFNMIDILAMHSDLAIAEESPIEKAIQAFCILSFMLFCYESCIGVFVDEWNVDETSSDKDNLNHYYQIWVHGTSLLTQNFPFFIIRIVFWIRNGVCNLGFLAKNAMAIVFGIAEIWSARRNMVC